METVFSIMVSITVLARTVEFLFAITVVVTIRSVWYEAHFALAVLFETSMIVFRTIVELEGSLIVNVLPCAILLLFSSWSHTFISA